MRQRKWTVEQLKSATKESTSIRQILHLLGLKEAGGNYSQISKYLMELKIDTKHIKGKGWSKGLRGIGHPQIKLEEILVRNSNFQSYKLKKRLFIVKLKEQRCEECGWEKVSKAGRIPLELDHINGNSKDNRLENLRILCPNCHSLKPTHRGCNKNKLS